MVASHSKYSSWRSLRQYKKIPAKSKVLFQANTKGSDGNQCSGFIRSGDPRCLLGIPIKGSYMSIKVLLTIIYGVTMNIPCKWFMEYPIIFLILIWENGRASLGDTIYRHITSDQFSPEALLSSLDLSSEHNILDLKNRVEASIVIWKRKMNNKDNKPSISSWGSTVNHERREVVGERAETLLLLLKHRYPGLPQSVLDMNKIQYNKVITSLILFFVIQYFGLVTIYNIHRFFFVV